MTGPLIVNRYLQITPASDGPSGFVLTAPVRSVGLRSISITKSEDPDIFAAFSELAATNVGLFDPCQDLSARSINYLKEHGVLGYKDEMPQMPLFECLLSEIKADESDSPPGTLTVNPSLRFNPFDLTRFSELLHERHVSPYKPSATIRTEANDVELTYWLEPAEAEVVSRLIPGHTVDFAIDEPILSRLLQSEILIDREKSETENQARRDSIRKAADEFRSKGYAVVTSILPPAQISAMQRFYRKYVSDGFMSMGDGQVPGRFRQHNEPLAKHLHRSLQNLMEMIVGEPLKCSYVYAASYTGGAILDPHTDREQCEFSISFQVDYQPEPADGVSPWAIHVEPLRSDEPLGKSGTQILWSDIDTSSASAIHLANGDGLFYKGRELVHYRYALPDGHTSTSLFFHFVPETFAGNLA